MLFVKVSFMYDVYLLKRVYDKLDKDYWVLKLSIEYRVLSIEYRV